MMFAYGETVTVHRPPVRDRTGDRAPGADTHHTIDGCAIDYSGGAVPGAAREATDRRETVIASAVLYAPAGADIHATDRVELPDGQVYRVDGAPQPWRSPFTGWTPGVVVTLKAVL